MSDFTTVYPETINLDPSKRVNYTHGLVLGVDEFLQEELYLLEKHRFHNRSLHGYGTVCGLAVSWKNTEKGPEIKVTSGIAIDPGGKEIRVPRDQCALLNEWLMHNKEKVVETVGSPATGPLTLYLTLCYRECKTDTVPIPSGPCHSLEDTSVPSRVADNFELKFVTEDELPEHIEEEAVRDFIALLKGIDVSDASPSMTLEDLEKLILTLKPQGSPPDASPTPVNLPIPPDKVQDYLRAAFRIWITKVRPFLEPKPSSKEDDLTQACRPRKEKCVTLARLDFDVEETEIAYRVVGDVTIDEENRPYLLHTRLIQEYLNNCCTLFGRSDILISPPYSINEYDCMHLTGDETVSGTKTFTDPLMLSGNGRVEKRIALAAREAQLNNTAVSQGIFQTVSSLQFITTGGNAFKGEALFGVPVPDDIDLKDPLRIRLLWGFTVSGRPSRNLTYTWQVRNKYLGSNEAVPSSEADFPNLDIQSTINTNQQNKLLATEVVEIPDQVERGDLHGALRIGVSALNPPTAQIFLVQIELLYVANCLGGKLP